MNLIVAFLNCRSHGDCAVITFEDSNKPACIVIDGGEDNKSAKALLDYLNDQKVKVIDLMVGTHIDSDHINGLKYFVQDQLANKKKNKPFIAIKTFWGPKPSEGYSPTVRPTSSPENRKLGASISWQQFILQSVDQNDDLCSALKELGAAIVHPALDNKPKSLFKSINLELLGPDTQIPADHIKTKALGLGTEQVSEGPITTLEDLERTVNSNYESMAIEANRNANNQSIVFRLTSSVGNKDAKDWSFLFTGDAEEEAWEEMCGSSAVATKLNAKVLKIPHHGSSLNGITDAGAAKVKPEYSINSVGQKHGLPDEETLVRLNKLKSKILCTQRNQDKKKKSACYSITGEECPAKGDARNVIFKVDTATGKCTITPLGRACKHRWQ